MAAKGSKSRRPRTKPAAQPDAEAQPAEAGPEEPSPGVEAGQPPPGPEPRSPEAEGDSRPDTVAAGDDDALARRGQEEAASAPEGGEPLRPAPRRYGVTAGLAAMLVVAGLAGVWIYRSAGDPDRLAQHVQRIDIVTQQAETQASRLEAAEAAITGLRSEVGDVTAAVSALEASHSDLRSAVEANRQELDQMAQSIEGLRGAVAVPADGTAAGEAVADLRTAIETLGERVASLEQGDHLADITASIGRLEQEFSQLRDQAIARLEAEIADLREQAVGRIEEAEAATALGRAYAALSERLAAGAPFADELEAVAAELPTAPGVEVLRPHAGEGVATLPDLQARLGDIAAGLAREAPEGVAPEDSVWQTIRERLEGMVTIRPSVDADGPEALAQADEALERGDVATAIAAVEQVRDTAPAALDPWLADARARHDAEAALDELSAAVLRQFAGRR